MRIGDQTAGPLQDCSICDQSSLKTATFKGRRRIVDCLGGLIGLLRETRPEGSLRLTNRLSRRPYAQRVLAAILAFVEGGRAENFHHACQSVDNQVS
jgi:hypothetical protein